MKRIGVIFLLVAVLCLGGCNKAQKEKEDVNNWCMEDLKFYDYEGKPAWELTVDNRAISLSDKAGLQTYRGVKIGDDAKEVLSQYDMGDFKFEMASVGRGDEVGEAVEELDEKYKDVTPKEMLNRLAEVPDFGGTFYYTTHLYIIDGKLYRQSEVEDDTHCDYLFWVHFYIKNERIDNIKIIIWG